MPARSDHDSTAAPPRTAAQQAQREQTTPELTRKCRRYAEKRARMVRASGRPVPKGYARELVHDAYVDTWFGIAEWEPGRCSLLVHLRGLIKLRTWAEVRHGRQVPQLSLDVKPAAEDAAAIEDALVASSGDIGPIVLASLVRRVCSELRQLAALDQDCLALVSCWEAGAFERDEVMRVTGLDAEAHARARKRLLYQAARLPTDVREAAQDYLRRAS